MFYLQVCLCQYLLAIINAGYSAHPSSLSSASQIDPANLDVTHLVYKLCETCYTGYAGNSSFTSLTCSTSNPVCTRARCRISTAYRQLTRGIIALHLFSNYTVLVSDYTIVKIIYWVAACWPVQLVKILNRKCRAACSSPTTYALSTDFKLPVRSIWFRSLITATEDHQPN